MSANPPIAAIANQTQTISPNENIHRYLHSIHPNQAIANVDQPPTPPPPDPSSDPLSPSGRERASHQSQHVIAIDAPESLSGDKTKAQLRQIANKWRSELRDHLDQEAEDDDPRHTSYTVRKKGQGATRRQGNASHQAQDEVRWETESAARRAERKIRRQDRAAIFDPKPSPQPQPRHQIKQRTKRPAPDPSSSVLGSGSAKEARTQAKIMKKMPPQLRTYNPPNVFVTGRLTTKPQRASRPLFYGKAVESRPFPTNPAPHANAAYLQNDFYEIGRGSNYVSSTIASPPRHWDRPPLRAVQTRQPSLPPTESNHSTFQQNYPPPQSYQYQKRPDTIPNAYDYNRLPPPGLTNSPSWPTNPSDMQSSKLSGPRPFVRQAPAPAVHAQKAPSTYSRSARSELLDITSRGQWRWPPNHPVIQPPKPIQAIRSSIVNDPYYQQQASYNNSTPRSIRESYQPASTSGRPVLDPTSSSPLFRLNDTQYGPSRLRPNVMQGAPICQPSDGDQLWKREERSRSGEDEQETFWQQRRQPSSPYERDRSRDHIYGQQEDRVQISEAEVERGDGQRQGRLYSPAPFIPHGKYRSPETNGIYAYVPPGRIQHPNNEASRQDTGFDEGYGNDQAITNERGQEQQEDVYWNDGERRQDEINWDESSLRYHQGELEQYGPNEGEWKALWRGEM